MKKCPTGPMVLAFSALLVTTACGAITPALPTAASPLAFAAASSAAPAPAPAAAAQSYPSLTGRWRSAGTRVVYRNIETGTTPGGYSCQGMLTVDRQDGDAFTGSFSTQGNGWNSDRFCTGSGTLQGELMEPDGSEARASLAGGFSANQCTFVSGNGEFAGTARADGISLQRVDIYNCPVNMDGGPGMPVAQFERTITLSFERW
jgi:hypothetical protein